MYFRYVGGTLLKLTYGVDTARPDDPSIMLGERQSSGFARAAMPGAFLVETLPIRE